MLRFESPWMLLVVPLAIAAAWGMARRRRRGDARLALPLAGAAVAYGGSAWVRLDRAVPVLRGLALVLLALALARPQSGAGIEEVSTHGVDIVVALDVSGSMRAEDFQPQNRLEVAKHTVEDFVRGRPGDRVGLVVFASVAATRAPLTQDHEMLRQFLDEVDFAPAEQDGTAIGLGLATAVNRLRRSEAKSKVVVLVTDGRNNRGQIGPKAAAEAARALGIKVHTIGVGSDAEEVPVPFGPLGRRYVRIDIDEQLLREMAELTGGRYFRATDGDGLREVFREIDALEKTEIESQVRVVYSETFPALLLSGAALLIVERLLVRTRLRRVP